jgi:hypothetical protein
METKILWAQANASPNRNEQSEYIGDLEHSFGLELEKLLDIKKRKTANNGGNSLNQSEEGKKRPWECNKLVLDSRYDLASGVDSIYARWVKTVLKNPGSARG